MIASHLRLSQVLIFATLCMGLCTASSLPPIMRFACAAPLLFFLPGYTLVRLMNPSSKLSAETLLFCIGLSCTISIFVGFCLNAFNAMTPTGWSLALSIVIVGLTLLASHNNPETDGPVRPFTSSPLSTPLVQLTPIFLLIVATAFAIAYFAKSTDKQFDYSDFWIVSEPGDLVRLGLKNMEKDHATYHVEIMIDGKLADVWQPISLDVGETWTAELNIPTTPPSPRVEAWVFRNHDINNVYRRVWLAAEEDAQ